MDILIEDEIWKDIPGYEGKYQVSNYGRVKSLERWVDNGSEKGYVIPERMKVPTLNTNGYLMVSLYKDNKEKHFTIHRLVAKTFHAVEFGNVVNHIDGNKFNNRPENLEIVTSTENNRHAFATGLNSGKNETHYRTNLTNEQVREMKRLGKYGTYKQIAKDFNTTESIVNHIFRGDSWRDVE